MFTRATFSRIKSHFGRNLCVVVGVLLWPACELSLKAADDWGAYCLVPACAPAFVLESTGQGKSEAAVVSIGKPNGGANQKWFILPKGDDLFAIKPSPNSTQVLTAAQGGADDATPIVLETDHDQPWQAWHIVKNANDTFSLIPQHAPKKGLDHFAGKPVAGARIDLWTYKADDQHLQWKIKPLAGSALADHHPLEPAPAGYVPPTIKPEDVPQGEIKQCSFAESAIFPGTVRDVAVFIPAQYDGSKPACVYVKTDGYNPAEKPLLETLIATKEMPATIGVFVRPGDVPAPMKDTMGRRNRCFEYDAVGDNNVRFLVDELLPYVAKKFDLKLSASGNDRCIAGGSSGGIAAFTAAWERTDAFSRVYANSGSFVAFRGGHEYPTLVRKFEAKPLRAFLTTGTHDMENCAGDWFLVDQEMDKALRFSGYDYTFRIIDGGHVAGYYENFPEAMSYIWKGWPAPVQAGTSAPRVRDVILPGEDWQLVADDRHDARGPACDAGGNVFFVDPPENKILKIDLEGKLSEFASDAGQASGLTCGAAGELYAVSAQTGRIMRYDSHGKSQLVAEGIPGDSVIAMPGGELYVTSNSEQPPAAGTVWLVKNGKKTQVDTGLKSATGLAYRPDQWLLAVADGKSKWAYSYKINPDGTLANKERYFWFHVPDWEDDAGTAALCYAKEGQLLAATRWGIQICADDGPTQVILPMPDRSRVVGVCLAGAQFDTLFAFCGEKIWRRKVKIHSLGAFTPWTPVHGTPL